MSQLSDSLASNPFTLTAELNPPKGADLERLCLPLPKALKGFRCTAFNLTDSAASRMAMAPLAVARLLKDRDVSNRRCRSLAGTATA